MIFNMTKIYLTQSYLRMNLLHTKKGSDLIRKFLETPIPLLLEMFIKKMIRLEWFIYVWKHLCQSSKFSTLNMKSIYFFLLSPA